MSDNHTDTDDLEAAAAQQRARLAVVLDALGEATSGKGGASPMDAVSKAASALPGTAMDTALDLAKRNPLAVALLTAGAASLLLGKDLGLGKERSEGHDPDKRLPTAKPVRTVEEPVSARLMRQNLGAGLDELDAAARMRVVNSRLQAIEAQETLERQAEPEPEEDSAPSSGWKIGVPLIAACAGALAGGYLMRRRKAAPVVRKTSPGAVTDAVSDQARQG